MQICRIMVNCIKGEKSDRSSPALYALQKSASNWSASSVLNCEMIFAQVCQPSACSHSTIRMKRVSFFKKILPPTYISTRRGSTYKLIFTTTQHLLYYKQNK